MAEFEQDIPSEPEPTVVQNDFEGGHGGQIQVGDHPVISVQFYSKEQPLWSGWIEPADGSWIIFLGKDGSPVLYYSERDSTGAVVEDSRVDLR